MEKANKAELLRMKQDAENRVVPLAETQVPPLPYTLPVHYQSDPEPSSSTTPYPEPHPETLLEQRTREGEDYGRRQGYSAKRPDSFVPDFPNILEAETTNMNQFHDTAAPAPPLTHRWVVTQG